MLFSYCATVYKLTGLLQTDHSYLSGWLIEHTLFVQFIWKETTDWKLVSCSWKFLNQEWFSEWRVSEIFFKFLEQPCSCQGSTHFQCECMYQFILKFLPRAHAFVVEEWIFFFWYHPLKLLWKNLAPHHRNCEKYLGEFVMSLKVPL